MILIQKLESKVNNEARESAVSMLKMGAASQTGQIDLEKKMNIKFNKNYTEEKLVSDAIGQKEDLQDLMSYLMLFLNVSKVARNSKNEKICVSQDDRAISLLLKRFGYSLDKVTVQKVNRQKASKEKVSQQAQQSSFAEYDVKIESVYGVYSGFTIKGINQYTNRRKRVSLAICDKQRGMNSYFLVVKGDETVMKECLSLDKKERNQFKQLIASYKN